MVNMAKLPLKKAQQNGLGSAGASLHQFYPSFLYKCPILSQAIPLQYNQKSMNLRYWVRQSDSNMDPDLASTIYIWQVKLLSTNLYRTDRLSVSVGSCFSFDILCVLFAFKNKWKLHYFHYLHKRKHTALNSEETITEFCTNINSLYTFVTMGMFRLSLTNKMKIHHFIEKTSCSFLWIR